jgi:polysaccharide biosynthesis/export protein VpsN
MGTHFVNCVLFVLLVALSTLGFAAEKGASPAGSAPSSAAASGSASSGTTLSSYRLGSGDLISIQVLGEDDLRRERVRLSDAGTISFPVLGELQVAGITVGELEQNIAKGLKGRYLQNPVVTVTIHEYRQFFINGQVGRPGGYPFIPGLTIRKAVTTAGGFKERAAPDKIFVIRDTDPTQKPRRVTLDTSVQPGDVITVEESFF